MLKGLMFYRWTVYDTNVKLEKGDVIRYYIFVSIDGLGYIKDGLSYVVGGEYNDFC